jgi:hypothetical protein
VVYISWHALDGRRESHSFSLDERCDTFEKASALALKAAKDWVDRHLIPVDSSSQDEKTNRPSFSPATPYDEMHLALYGHVCFSSLLLRGHRDYEHFLSAG